MNKKPRIAIIGAGLIGASWTALFCNAGNYDVTVWDPSPAALADFPARLAAAKVQLVALGHASEGKITIASSLSEAVAEADWIQENSPERLPLKCELYAELEALIGDNVVIASSTSAFCWSELAVGMKYPARLITAHPFNPPHLIPLVEIFGTEAGVVARAVDLFASVGRRPVVLKKDAVGHIANRLSSALWREAVSIVAEGIASVEDVDAALVNGPGLRWAVNGAHLTYHLGGGSGGIESYLNQLGPSQERRWASLGSPSLTSEVKQALIDGIDVAVQGRSIAELAGERDEALIQILNTKASLPETKTRSVA